MKATDLFLTKPCRNSTRIKTATSDTSNISVYLELKCFRMLVISYRQKGNRFYTLKGLIGITKEELVLLTLQQGLCTKVCFSEFNGSSFTSMYDKV